MTVPHLQVGIKIIVFDDKKMELGEGTFVKRDLVPELNMTVYECQEHVILAKGAHWIKTGSVLHHVSAGE